MTSRTRNFVVIASVFLFAGIGAAGVVSYLGLGTILASDSSEELSYVPAEAQLVAYVDIRRVMDSELRRKLQPDLGSSSESSRLFDETGIYLETDVDSLVVAAFNRPDAPGQTPGLEAAPADAATEYPLLLARGRFDTSRIESAVRSNGGAASEYRGVRVVTSEHQHLSVAFLRPGLLAVGSRDTLRRALDARAAGTATVGQDAGLMQLVRRVDTADLWTVGRFDALQGYAPIPPGVASQLPAIAWFAAGARVGSGLDAVVHADARDEQAAQDFREVVRGFVALVRMQMGQQPDFADLLNSIELAGEGTTISLGFSVPGHTIDRLGALVPRGSDAPGAPRRRAPGRAPVSGAPRI